MRLKPVLKSTAACLLATTPFTGSALAQPIVLEDIVISANRAESEAARTGADVSVVTESTFQADGRPFALEYLETLPGVTVQRSGPAGTVSGFAIRGAPQQYVRVEIDGIEISDPTGPQVAPSLSGLLVDDMSRIEVLKGSQSALYGGQAVAGVIAITSPRATEDGFEARYLLEGGSYGTARGRVSLAGRDERGDVVFTLAHYETDGFSAAEEDDGNTEDDAYRTTRVSASGTLYATDTVSLFASAFQQVEDGDFDGGPGPGGDAPNTFEQTTWGARAGLDFEVFGEIENQVAVSYFDIDRDTDSFDPIFGPSEFNTDGDRVRVEYTGRYDVSDQLGVQLGADWTKERSKSNFSNGTESNSITGVYGQADWSPVDTLTVNAALRFDEHSEFGGYTSGRLTAAYQLQPGTILRGSLGNGFRAPSNFELFDGFSGNPDLEPETSVSADIGIEQSFAGGRGTAQATLFYLRIDDLIEFDPNTFVYFQTDGTSESRGVEVSAAWNFTETLTLSGAYTYTDAELPDGSQRNRVPRNELAAFLDGAVTDRFDVGVGIRAVNGYVDDSTTVESVNFEESFAVVDARAAWNVTDSAQVYLRVENLLDAQYQTARGYGTSDRAWFFGVTSRF